LKIAVEKAGSYSGISATLLPEQQPRRELVHTLFDEINAFWDLVPAMPLGPSADAQMRREWLKQFDFSQPQELRQIIREVLAQVEQGTLLTQHPRYFGLFNSAPAFPAVLGEFLSAAINPQLAAASHAPLAVEIERHLISRVGSRVGWPSTAGHFTTGGAEANMVALLLALTSANPDYSDLGSRAYGRQPTFYASEEAHLAWFKVAHQLGIGRQALRLVRTDGKGRMSPEALSDTIHQDVRAGNRPILIVATAGTTGAGMIDPLTSCAEIARQHGLWYHVDAAWAGALIASPRLRSALAGIERADSITIDAHKWFSVPIGAGMFLTRHDDILAEAFRVSTSYMPAATDIDEPYTHSPQWSRRFMGLKFFLTLASIGWDGYAELIERHVAVANYLEEALKSHHWVIENNSPAAVLCFTDARGHEPPAIADVIQRRQNAWISTAELEKKAVLRACVTNFRTGEDDVDCLVEELDRARAIIDGTAASDGLRRNSAQHGNV
jgi:glutamate/tyrosine decarboxylase-like PLP-dependent enzyme